MLTVAGGEGNRMEDAELVHRCAAHFLGVFGAHAVAELQERASIALEKRDALSRCAWLDIAAVIETDSAESTSIMPRARTSSSKPVSD
jgi:hypothetical protein